MMRAALCLLLLVPASLAAQTPLQWKLEPGQAWVLERLVKQEQKVELGDKLFRQRLDSIWRVHLEVLTPIAEQHRLRASLQEVQHRLQGTVGTGIDHNLGDKLQGRQFTLVVAPSGLIRELQGYADFIDQATEKDPERSGVLRAMVPEDALREAFSDLLGPLPEQPVMPGSMWKRTVREPIPLFGALRGTWQYTAQGPTAGGYHLAYAITTEYEAPAAGQTVLFRISKGSLRGENGRGKVIFDATQGRLVRHERHLTVRGTLTVERGGMQVPLQLVSENTMEVRAPAR
jgi:hypothetical protein